MSEIGSYEGAEIVVALVAAAGTDLDRFQDEFSVQLDAFRYRTSAVRLSALTGTFVIPGHHFEERTGSSEFVRLMARMDAGNAARQRKGGDVLALAAAAEIHRTRPTDREGTRGPRPRTAHVVRSLKHPAEVQTLRRIYGPGLFVVGIDCPQELREKFLVDRKGCTKQEVAELLKRDEHEGGDGQRRRDTYELSDVFVRLGDIDGLRRFLRLVFGDPYETPTPDEHAMFLAFAAALRSGDLSRQVGAVVVSEHGDVIAVGTNDVPKAGGGLHWPGKEDDRDLTKGFDTNQIERQRIVEEILALVAPSAEHDQGAWQREARRKLKDAAVWDITEYGRPVHAEMEAMLSCARSGVSTRGATLFSTTFPCHNCAKHLLAAGIARVVYVEPYAKSRAGDFYPRSIRLEEGDAQGDSRTNPVRFVPFRGVGPRRFLDLFSLGLGSGYAVKRKEPASGEKRDWKSEIGEVRVPLLPNSYLDREAAAARKLVTTTLEEDDRDDQAGA